MSVKYFRKDFDKALAFYALRKLSEDQNNDDIIKIMFTKIK